MNFDPAIALAIGVPSVTALVWLIRLEGRVNTNDVVTAALRADVTYIRSRIDAALGGHTHGHSRREDRDDT